MLRGMVEYADFHTTVATLSPIFWLVGLVGWYRGAASNAGSGENPVLLGLASVAIASTAMVIAVGGSLAVLGGAFTSTGDERLVLAFCLVFQLVMGVWGFVADLLHQDRRR